jgi:hypothetical protein
MKLLGIAVLCTAAACGDDGNNPHPIDAPAIVVDAADPTVRTEVLSVPATANRDVDILFMVDDSPSMLDKQMNLVTNFPNFINVIDALPGGRPNLHLGVVTSDLGTSAAGDANPGPSIGSSNGGCAAQGKAGNLTTNNSTAITGKFISDIAAGSTRATNYTGTLAAAFTQMASVGQAGCGFEQSIEAVKRALNNNTANAGFLRPSANLVILFVSDEDDCSLEHVGLVGTDPTTFGPLDSFRCTRFGITCDQGGATTDAMNQVGTKTSCHSNESGANLTKIADYATFLKGLKSDPRKVMVGALVGPATPFAVELRTPAGGTTAQPELAHACSFQSGTATSVADPAVRIAELAGQFEHHAVDTICQADLSPGLGDIAQQLAPLLGSPCLTQAIAQPADCVVADVTLAGVSTPIPKCPSSGDCYTIATDATLCPIAPQLALQLTRVTTPAADAVTTVKCKLP